MSACTKISYATKNDAYRALRNLPQRRRRAVNVYRCDRCQAWHLGRPSRADRLSNERERFPNGLTLADVWDPEAGWHRPSWRRASVDQRRRIEALAGRYPKGIDYFSEPLADEIIEALESGEAFALVRRTQTVLFRPVRERVLPVS